MPCEEARVRNRNPLTFTCEYCTRAGARDAYETADVDRPPMPTADALPTLTHASTASVSAMTTRSLFEPFTFSHPSLFGDSDANVTCPNRWRA